MTLGDKIRNLRKKKGLSQGELADKIGISGNHLSRLERGHYQPSADVLKKVAGVLEVSTDYILSESNSDSPEVQIQDASLAERVRMLDQLDDEDKTAIIRVIDSMLTKQRMRKLLGDAARSVA